MKDYFLFLMGLLVLQVSSAQDFQLQTGDLLFQDINCGPMCDAIESVTQGYDNANFSHVGIAVQIVDSFYVLEAISAGVVLTPIQQFLRRSVDEQAEARVMVGRLKIAYQNSIPDAIHRGLQYLGKPYDGIFDINNDSYYCSELVYEAFHLEEVPIFKLYPMTFKPLGSTDFFSVWVEYYEQLRVAIPEGKLGLNPGGISRSSYLDIVHWFGEVSRKR